MEKTKYDPNLSEIEKRIGYHFKDKNLGITAITTRAYSNEHTDCTDNQALEYLGDAVLSLVIAGLLYEKWMQLQDNEAFVDLTPEGVMSKVRQKIVNNQYLSDCVKKHDLCKYIYNCPDDHGAHNNDLHTCSGSDIIEALIAAIYLDNDRSITIVKRFILDFLDISNLLNNEPKLIEVVIQKNHKDALIHKYQKLNRYTPFIEYPEFKDKFNKQDNTHHFVLGIRIDGTLLHGITGEGQNKATAEFEAAKAAYHFLESIDWDLSQIDH
jgi:ribonuclease-3